MQYLQPKPYFTRLGHMIWLVGLFFFFKTGTMVCMELFNICFSVLLQNDFLKDYYFIELFNIHMFWSSKMKTFQKET
jgi:hypothetical protein